MASLVTRNCMNWSFFPASAFSNSSQRHFAVDFPCPNCKQQLVKEFHVVNRHKANQSNPFCCFWRSGLTTLHMYSKVGRQTRKCSFHRTPNAWFLKKNRKPGLRSWPYRLLLCWWFSNNRCCHSRSIN